MGKPHIHADLIKAWADGAEIEVMLFNGTWIRAPFPVWDHDIKFRLKPQPKPDIGVMGVISRTDYGDLHIAPNWIRGPANVRLIFDGETNTLKAVELIK